MRAQAVGQARRALEPQARSALANDDRRHGQVQPVQASLGEKTRHRHAAAFDKESRQAARLQRRHGVRQVRRGVVAQQVAHGQHAICADLRDGIAPPPCITQPQRGCLPVIEDMRGLEVASKSQLRIEQHTGGIGAGHAAGRQAGIVGCDRAGAHDHGVAHGAQAMKMQQVLGAVDEARVAGARGHAAIQALAQLGDHPCRALWPNRPTRV